jgi:16S rRNA (cytidine1402-2'-O)-methyltransferase
MDATASRAQRVLDCPREIENEMNRAGMNPSRSDDRPRGCLYLVATPIGNLEDISLRALRILKEADLIACEDTRQTLKLLTHFEIRKPLESYHEHNEMTRAPELVLRMEKGEQIALVSDAGTPVISDPGHRLVSLCLRHRIPVIPIPGPSAIVAALAASGMPSDEFTFLGFLPARPAERRRALRRLIAEPRTMVFYESPQRLRQSLEDALEILGNRHAAVARELTKIHEELLHGRIEDLIATLAEKPPRGEITLLIGPPETEPRGTEHAVQIDRTTLGKRIAEIERAEGVDRKTALKQAAKEFGLAKREAYKRIIAEENS